MIPVIVFDKVKHILMKKIALISAMLFFIVYFWANTFMPEDDSGAGIYPVVAANPLTEASVVDEAILTRIMDAEAPAEAGLLSEAESPSEAAAPSAIRAAPGSGGVYYLIVASFSDIDQAQRVAEKYTNDYNADIIILPPTPQGYYRISYGIYSTPEEAGAALPAVREAVNPDAWIYSIKKPR
ncbi:SPOR domain-containing protein [bacterium]|nr:SPOR domain-containing protein [bacterium]